MGSFRDLTGQRFGRLTVLKRAGSDNQNRATWLCRCDCGIEHIVSSSNLLSGKTQSCGCIHREMLASYNTKHGKGKCRLYGVWKNMKRRCYSPKVPQYPRYGGRGITVCDEWRNDFSAFYEWAMANGYDENAALMQCTIDRIDNDKGYSPDNCRWVDNKTQCNNRSHSGPLPKKQRSNTNERD